MKKRGELWLLSFSYSGGDKLIFFYNDVRKADLVALKAQLERFIEKREPRLARLVARETSRLGASVSYQDITDALLNGEISEEWLEKWRVLYSEFVIRYLVPVWKEAFDESVKQMADRYPKFLFDPNTTMIQEWVADRGAMLVTNIVEQQRAAIRGVVSFAVQPNSNMTVDELAKVIRPMVGLYPAQAVANIKYYDFVKKGLIERHPRTSMAKITERAQRAAAKYAATQHRARAMTIARTELGAAYNMGEYNSVIQAQEKNYIGTVKKGIVTARDEIVCDFCKSMDEQVRGYFDMEEVMYTPNGTKLYTQGLTPPFHPRCRCAVVYEEVEPPIPFVEN